MEFIFSIKPIFIRIKGCHSLSIGNIVIYFLNVVCKLIEILDKILNFTKIN